MTNNHHAVGVIGGITSPSTGGQAPSMAMAFNKNNQGNTANGKNGSNQQMNTIIPSNKQAAAHYQKHQQYS